MTDEKIEVIREFVGRNYPANLQEVRHLLNKYDKQAARVAELTQGNVNLLEVTRALDAKLTKADAILRDVADFKVTIVAGPQGQQVCGICNGFVDEPGAASHFDGCLVRRARQHLEES